MASISSVLAEEGEASALGDSSALGDADVVEVASALGDSVGLAVGEAEAATDGEGVVVVALGCWQDANANAMDTGNNK